MASPVFLTKEKIEQEILEKSSSPDAHLGVDGGDLKLVKADDTTAWTSAEAVRYDLPASAGTTLKDRAINPVNLAADRNTLTIPTTGVDGKAIDFIIDAANTSGSDATIEFTNGASVKLVARDGAAVADMLAVANGENALFTLTQKFSRTEGVTEFVITKMVVA